MLVKILTMAFSHYLTADKSMPEVDFKIVFQIFANIIKTSRFIYAYIIFI